MFLLKKIEIEDVSLIAAYKDAMIQARSRMDGCSGLSNQRDLHKYVCRCKDYEIGVNVVKGDVPTTQYICINDENIIVGMCSLRHSLNDLLLNVGGHIGYSVHPNYRRQGVATFMLGQLLKICKEKDIHQVLITCLESNIASKKTILKYHGVFEDFRYIGNEIVERYWINL